MSLDQRSCTACRGGVEPLAGEELQALLAQVPGWALDDDARRIRRRYRFRDFAAALAFTNAIGALSEAEAHHPDLRLGWGYVEVSLTTHKIGGLHENDFILAARIDALPQP